MTAIVVAAMVASFFFVVQPALAGGCGTPQAYAPGSNGSTVIGQGRVYCNDSEYYNSSAYLKVDLSRVRVGPDVNMDTTYDYNANTSGDYYADVYGCDGGTDDYRTSALYSGGGSSNSATVSLTC